MRTPAMRQRGLHVEREVPLRVRGSGRDEKTVRCAAGVLQRCSQAARRGGATTTDKGSEQAMGIGKRVQINSGSSWEAPRKGNANLVLSLVTGFF